MCSSTIHCHGLVCSSTIHCQGLVCSSTIHCHGLVGHFICLSSPRAEVFLSAGFGLVEDDGEAGVGWTACVSLVLLAATNVRPVLYPTGNWVPGDEERSFPH